MPISNVRWFDDWYLIEDFGFGLFGIGEPKYHQINWNYLIAGKKRALLFDTGPGLRDISPVVASLTDRPVTALLSHLHYDHTGNFHRFADTALADLPILRACERGWSASRAGRDVPALRREHDLGAACHSAVVADRPSHRSGRKRA